MTKQLIADLKSQIETNERLIKENFKIINSDDDFKICVIEKSFKDKDIFFDSDNKKNFVVIDSLTAIVEDSISYKNNKFMLNIKEVESMFNNRDYGEFVVKKVFLKSFHTILLYNCNVMKIENIKSKKIIKKLESGL